MGAVTDGFGEAIASPVHGRQRTNNVRIVRTEDSLMGRFSFLYPVLALVVFVTLTAPTALEAQAVVNIAVTTTADDVAVNGNCTLREAILAANTDSAVDACAAGHGADTIVVPAGVYVLSLLGPADDTGYTGDLDLLGALTIRGSGAGVTIIDGGWSGYSRDDETWQLLDRVMHVLPGSNVTLAGVTVQGGVCWIGGGIFNGGTLLLDRSVVQGNRMTWDAEWCYEPTAIEEGGAGIYNAGDLVVSYSQITGNTVQSLGYETIYGGGILNAGNANVERSTISGNTGAIAGGILNLGDVRVTDTDINGNGARFYGGGLWNSGTATLTRSTVSYNSDGGIYSIGGSLVLLNTTIAHNVTYRTQASGIYTEGPAEIVSSTIANNGSLESVYGGGLAGSVTLRNSIVTGNATADCVTPVSSLGNNLDGDGTCGLNGAGDLVATDAALGPLADNGGPTPTLALLPGSPAIDRIAIAQCASIADQRGARRAQGAPFRCDIGAYEYSPAGDLGLIVSAVRDYYHDGAITIQQERALITPLKSAGMAAGSLYPEVATACQALGEFAALVSGYQADGRMSAKVGSSLLQDAARTWTLMSCE